MLDAPAQLVHPRRWWWRRFPAPASSDAFPLVRGGCRRGRLRVLSGLGVRKWAQREEPVGSFTLEDLRDLRARGQITEQEFAALRAALLSDLRVLPMRASAAACRRCAV